MQQRSFHSKIVPDPDPPHSYYWYLPSLSHHLLLPGFCNRLLINFLLLLLAPYNLSSPLQPEWPLKDENQMMPLFCLKPFSIFLLHFSHLSEFTFGHSLLFSLGCSHTGLWKHILKALTCNFLCSWVFTYLAPSHNLGLSKNSTSLDRCSLDNFFQ